MSMNLVVKNADFDMPQIPTWDSELIMSINPETNKPDGGHKGVHRRLITWMRGRRQQVFNSLAHDRASQITLDIVWSDQIERAVALNKPKFAIE